MVSDHTPVKPTPTITRRRIVFPYPELSGLEHPAFEARGRADGPRLTLIGGVHGCEYSSIAAVVRFMNSLDVEELSGSITAVPIVSLESFRARSAFVVPRDGKNLNRAFPGDRDGSYTDVLAHAIFEHLIAPADILVDLHGGDQVEALEPFAIYAESSVEERSRELAMAFGLPYVVREPRQEGGLAGMTCTAAAEAGTPAIIAEAGGCGLLEESAVALLVDGVRNVCRSLGMLPGHAETRPAPRHVGRSLWLRCQHEGWWESDVHAGQELGAGETIGRIRNLWGDVLEEIVAPEAGVVLFLTTSPAVDQDGLLLGLGTDLD
jgi:uncharacterized protein